MYVQLNAITICDKQGIKPECLDKVGSKEVRQIIEVCTKAKINERYSDCTCNCTNGYDD